MPLASQEAWKGSCAPLSVRCVHGVVPKDSKGSSDPLECKKLNGASPKDTKESGVPLEPKKGQERELCPVGEQEVRLDPAQSTTGGVVTPWSPRGVPQAGPESRKGSGAPLKDEVYAWGGPRGQQGEWCPIGAREMGLEQALFWAAREGCPLGACPQSNCRFHKLLDNNRGPLGGTLSRPGIKRCEMWESAAGKSTKGELVPLDAGRCAISRK